MVTREATAISTVDAYANPFAGEPSMHGGRKSPSLPPIDPEREIRILELLPGELGDPIHCYMRVQVLRDRPNRETEEDSESEEDSETEQDATPTVTDGPHPYIPYEALSYTWGDWDNARTATINNFPVPITFNLWKALRRLRRQERIRYLWIDQICIDQASVAEKNPQIRLMGEIYRQAHRVLIWLGDWIPGASSKSASIPLLRNMGTDQAVVFDRSSDHEKTILRTLARAVEETYPRWSSRRWVVQEAVLARDSPIICAHDLELTRPRVQQAIDDGYCRGLMNFFWRDIERILEVRLEASHTRNLLRLVQRVSATSVSNPYDRLYSLHGLICPQERQHIVPDYGASLSRVYQQATYATILASGKLNILGLTGVSWDPTKQQDQDTPLLIQLKVDLPSWAVNLAGPIWGYPSFSRLAEARRWWCGQGSTECVVRWNEDFSTLDVVGIKLDSIVFGASQADGDEFASTPIGIWTMPPSRDESIDRGPVRLAVEAHTLRAAFEDNHLEQAESDPPPTRIPESFHTWMKGIMVPFEMRGQMTTSGDDNAWAQYFDFERSHRSTGFFPVCFTTHRGFVGLGRVPIDSGDVVALLCGAPAPAVLRPCEDRTWKFLCFAYVHGIMDDELLKIPSLKFEEVHFPLG